MNTILGTIDKENKLGYLMGDFNTDLFKSESCDYTNRFIEQLFTLSFFPLITKAAGITDRSETLIDNIFTNNLENLSDNINGIIFNDISDHLPIVHVSNANIFYKNRYSEEATIFYKRVYTRVNVNAFKDTIKNLSWKEVLDEQNEPEKAFDDFLDTYNAKFPPEVKAQTI